MVFIFLWLISLSKMSSNFIHVVANGNILLFLWMNSISLYMYMCIYLLLFSCCVMSSSFRPHGLQYPRLPCPSLSPGACPNLLPLSQWCHPTVSFSVIPFSCCLHSFPASGSFPMSWLFTSGAQSIGTSASASVLLMNIQDWSNGCWHFIYATSSLSIYPSMNA